MQRSVDTQEAELEKQIRQIVSNILRCHADALVDCVQRGTKVEPWLRAESPIWIELWRANHIEPSVTDADCYAADMSFVYNGPRYYLQLKTPSMKSDCTAEDDDILSVINDARKLVQCPGNGLVAFVLFPICTGDTAWLKDLQRIADELGISLSEEEHCTREEIELHAELTCEAVVCCFAYPQSPTTGADSPVC